MPHLQNRPVNFYMIGPRAVSDGWLLVRADELWAIGLDASLKMKGRYEMAFDVAGDPGTPTFRVQSGKIHNPMHNCSGDSCDYHVTSEFANCNLTKRGVLTCWGGWHGYQGGLRADYNVILTAVTGESFRIVSPDWLLDPSQVDEELMAKPQPGGSYYVGVKQSLFVTGP
jgi:hypothetical protein